jgi:hypothetical protein
MAKPNDVDRLIAHNNLNATNKTAKLLTELLLREHVCNSIDVLADIFVKITADPPDLDDSDDPADRLAYFEERVEAILEESDDD